MLYIIASPIGNLEDLTLRSIRILKEIDLIFCEDTRVTKKLLRHYEITKPLLRYIDDDSKINFYRDKLKSNDIALITDAGTPLLSDPGYKLINIARQNNIDVTSIPGSSALMTAVSLSGRKMNNFIFEGFFSKKSTDQLILSSKLRYRTKDTFLFDSPKRINATLNFFKNKYQITNPTYVAKDSSLIETVHNKYSLTEGISEKVYNKIISQILKNLPPLNEWHNSNILKKFDNETWNDSIIKLHDPKNIANYKSNFYRRLAYDEILSSFLVNSEIRKKIKKIKKDSKNFTDKYYKNTISKLNFNLTNDQKKALFDINEDLTSKSKMFRLLQGDVGSGKTIVSLISALNVIESNFQVALMAPTEILAKQHFILAK